jgi:hypothetical protein
MDKIINWIKQIFQDESGLTSSKRVVGVIASFALIAYMFITPSDAANNSVLILALGGLSMTSIEKIMKPK